MYCTSFLKKKFCKVGTFYKKMTILWSAWAESENKNVYVNQKQLMKLKTIEKVLISVYTSEGGSFAFCTQR